MQKNIEILSPNLQENEHLQKLEGFYKDYSEMSLCEREFLNAIVLRHKPKKLLELGVSAGGSSAIILNAIGDIYDAKLHSIDYNKKYYRDKSKNVGWIIEHYKEFKHKHNLYCGGLSLEFIENIGGNIEFALIDTMHCIPGEILDFLMVLPFLNDDAIVVFHDTNMHTRYKKGKPNCNIVGGFVNSLLISAIFGKKILQGNFQRNYECYFPNIAAIQLTKETKNYIFEVFNLLTLKWLYLPKEKELQELANFFEKYYDSYFVNYFNEVCDYQKAVFFCSGFDNTFKSTIKLIFKEILPKSLLWKIKNLNDKSES